MMPNENKQMVLIIELLLRDGTEPRTDSVDTTIDYDVIVIPFTIWS